MFFLGSAIDDFKVTPAEDEDEEDLVAQKIMGFHNTLKTVMLTRFGRDRNSDEPLMHPVKTGETWRIKTFNVFRNRTYTLAALLDPRVKALPFQGWF